MRLARPSVARDGLLARLVDGQVASAPRSEFGPADFVALGCLELVGHEGDRVRVEAGDGGVDLVAVVRAFWSSGA